MVITTHKNGDIADGFIFWLCHSSRKQTQKCIKMWFHPLLGHVFWGVLYSGEGIVNIFQAMNRKSLEPRRARIRIAYLGATGGTRAVGEFPRGPGPFNVEGASFAVKQFSRALPFSTTEPDWAKMEADVWCERLLLQSLPACRAHSYRKSVGIWWNLYPKKLG